MINRIIEWSLRNRFLVVCGAVLLAGFGVRALYQTPVDAIPDLSDAAGTVSVFTYPFNSKKVLHLFHGRSARNA